MSSLGELFEKLAMGDPLSDADRMALRQKGNNIEGQLSIFNPTPGLPYFTGVRPEELASERDHDTIKVAAQTLAQTLTNATYTKVQWAEIEHAYGFARPEVNATEVVVPETGMYFVSAVAVFKVNATGLREMEIGDTSGLTYSARATARAVDGAFTALSCSTTYLMTAGDNIFVNVWQNRGGDLELQAARMSIFRLWQRR